MTKITMSSRQYYLQIHHLWKEWGLGRLEREYRILQDFQAHNMWVYPPAYMAWIERRIKVLKTKKLISGSNDTEYWEPYEEGE